MQIYKNLSGESGVEAYEIGMDFLIVRFRKGEPSCYKYTNERTGTLHVEIMKSFAERGSGLNEYINKNVPKGYESCW